MKLPRFLLALGLLALSADLRAATAPAGRTEDLGQGLTYVLPAAGNAESPALLKAATTGHAVLDLRYFTPGERTSDWLAAIKTFVAAKRVCLVLVSPETDPALLAVITVGMPGCITIGRSSPALNVAIAVNTPADADRKAWEAIGHGTAPEKLLNPAVDKPRYDEAVLAKEHAADLNGDAPPEEAPPPAEKPKSEKKTAALTDAVLARAVQIHRGLLALRRL